MSGLNTRINATARQIQRKEDPHVHGVGRTPPLCFRKSQNPNPQDDAASVKANIFRATKASKRRKPSLPSVTLRAVE